MPEEKRCLIYAHPRALPQCGAPERQSEYLRRYAEQQGYTVVGEAADMTSVRTKAQSHGFDVLVIAALSQIGREMENVLSVLDGLSASGQTIHSVKEGLISPDSYKLVAMTAAAVQEMAAGAEAPEDGESEAPSPELDEGQSLSLT